jgi:hypothetical protein
VPPFGKRRAGAEGKEREKGRRMERRKRETGRQMERRKGMA